MSVEGKMYEAANDMISTWLHQARTEDKITTSAAYNCIIHALTRCVNDLHEARLNVMFMRHEEVEKLKQFRDRLVGDKYGEK